jgi:hypothetical protein
MVPFSFPQPLLESRVMKEYLTGALDDRINGFWDHWVHGVDHRPSRWWRREFGIRCFCPFLPSCFPYGNSRLCENPNEFYKIKVDQGKSNLFFISPHINTPILADE